MFIDAVQLLIDLHFTIERLVLLISADGDGYFCIHIYPVIHNSSNLSCGDYSGPGEFV